MSPEVQNRINEVKFECGMNIATLKKVNGIETALRWAQRGVLARGIRYFLFYVFTIIIMGLAILSGAVDNIVNKAPVAYQGPKKIYSHDPVEHQAIIDEISFVGNVLGFVPGLVIIVLFDLFINAPRRRQLKKLGEQGFLRQYARSNGLPENIFDVKRG